MPLPDVPEPWPPDTCCQRCGRPFAGSLHDGGLCQECFDADYDLAHGGRQ